MGVALGAAVRVAVAGGRVAGAVPLGGGVAEAGIVALAVGVVATGLSVLSIATLVPVWRERTWPIGRRLRHTVAVGLFVALVATLLHWNVIGFRY